MATERNNKKVSSEGEISRFQQFLWWVAGAERSILIECKTDYQKFTTIGAVIMVTTIFAFVAGGYAAWYFTQASDEENGNIIASIVFGLLWAVLIFCIDRSLVVTLKKDPTKKRQNIFVPLLVRMILAALIAIMVSIPLELFIFQGFIKQAETSFIINEKLNIVKKNDVLNDISKEEAWKNDLSAKSNSHQRTDSVYRQTIIDNQQTIDRLKPQLNNPTTEEYTAAVSSWDRLNKQIKAKRTELYYANNENDSTRITRQIKELNTKINSADNYCASLKKRWNEAINEKIKSLEVKNKDNVEQQAVNRKNLNITDSLLLEQTTLLAEERNKRDSLTRKQDILFTKSNRFINSYRILDFAVTEKELIGKDENTQAPIYGQLIHKTELGFFWLIRLLFFIIELAPTLVKIFMPKGPYEWRVYQEEKDLELHLSSDEYIQHKRELYRIQHEAAHNEIIAHIASEKALKDEIVQEMSQAQKEVALKFTEDWKDKQLRKLARSNKTHTI